MTATRKTEKKATKTEAIDGQSFEKSLNRLEHIVAEMEGGSLSLEDMITRFEEGQGLIKFCSRKLNEVERKIEILVKKGDVVEAEPFDEEGDEEEVSETETAEETPEVPTPRPERPKPDKSAPGDSGLPF